MKLNIYFIIIFISLNFLGTICSAQDDDDDDDIDIHDHIRSIKGIPTPENRDDLFFLKAGQIDPSGFLEYAESLLRQSDYENRSFFSGLGFTIQEEIKKICNLLPYRKRRYCLNNSYDTFLAPFILLKMQNNRILLPDDYYPVGELPEDIARLAREKLRSNCLAICKDKSIGEVLTHGSISQYNQTVHKLTELGSPCLKMALYSLGKQYKKYNEKIKPTGNCKQETGRQKNICERLKRNHEQITQRISDLVDIVTPQSSSETTLSLSASCLENNSSINIIDNFLKEVEDAHNCSEYQSGEERELYPRNRAKGGYKIKKEADGSYTVSMAIEFSYQYLQKLDHKKDRDPLALPSSHIFDSASYQNQTHNVYMQKTTECLNWANDYMLGPNGEQLNIVITDGKEDTCTPKHHIQIHRYFNRPNSANYSEDIDCPTMVHEVLHNAGLVDEYKEKATGKYVDVDTGEVIEVKNGPPPEYQEAFLPNQNCRVTQYNTIMSNQYERWGNTIRDDNRSISNGLVLSMPLQLPQDSLIDPIHFNAILYGNCEKKEDVRIYRQCSKLAYMTSYQEGTSNSACPSLKTECEKQNILGKSREELQKEYNLLGLNLRTLNSFINKFGRNLITLEQAAVQTGSIDSQRFRCSYPPRRLDISVCKENLRGFIKLYKQDRDELIQKQKRLRILMRQ